MRKSDLSKFVLVGILALSATSSAAESFAVKLGKTMLGTLTYSAQSDQTILSSTLSNTPMGVFNGTFQGFSRPTSDAQEFIGISKSSRKSREVQVQITAGQPTATKVTPSTEETALSDPLKSPDGMVDPVQAIGKLLGSRGCPKRINIYDGRRAIALIPDGSEQTDDVLTCAISYKVTAGPGHLSPLRISNAKMEISYSLQDNVQSINQIRIGSGIFILTLMRTN